MSRVVGPYRLEKQLGQGGLGDVYRARDDRLARTVALKLLPRAISLSQESRDRLFADAFLAATLAHPGIARLFDIGEHDGQPYLAFEFVEGRTLAARLAKGPLPVSEAVTFAIAVTDALSEAHRHGLPHRDLKPANVMVTPRGRPKVLDFGLSGWTDGQSRPRKGRGRSDGGRRRHAWHARIPLSGTGAGRSRRRALRPLLVGHHPLRDGHGAASLQCQHAHGPAAADPEERAAPSEPAEPGHSTCARSDHPPLPREEPGRALPACVGPWRRAPRHGQGTAARHAGPASPSTWCAWCFHAGC